MHRKFLNFRPIKLDVKALIKLAELGILIGAAGLSLMGCSVDDDVSQMKDSIKDGDLLVIDLYTLKDSTDADVETEELEWTQLDQMSNYKNFRIAFDTLFNINKVTSGDSNGKQGCLFVVPSDEGDAWDGNSTLYYGFRNEAFNKYWSNDKVRSELSKLSSELYDNIDANSSDALYASLGIYYDLFPSNEFDYAVDENLSRNDFLIAVVKSDTPVEEISLNESDASLIANLGVSDTNAYFIRNIQKDSYLVTSNGSLNKDNLNTGVSKLEVLYTIVNRYFSDELSNTKIDKKTTAFDMKNAGDLASKIGATVEEGKSKHTPHSGWQNNVLAYMIKSPDDGLDQSVMKHMVVAEKLNLTRGLTDVELTDPITKTELLVILTNTYNELNKQHGYLTRAEHPNLVLNDRDSILIEDTSEVVVDTIVAELEGEEITADNMEKYYEIFRNVYDTFALEERKADMTDSNFFDLEKEMIKNRMALGDLPSNGVELYSDWRLSEYPLQEFVVESKPVESKPVIKPEDVKPVEQKPVQQKPVQQKPVEQKPVQQKPVEQKPVSQAPTPSQTQQQEAQKKQEEQKAEQTKQEVSTKFSYPAGATTAGLTSQKINKGYYILGNKVLDQKGNFCGWAPSATANVEVTEEQHQQNRIDNMEQYKNMTGENMADTGNFN